MLEHLLCHVTLDDSFNNPVIDFIGFLGGKINMLIQPHKYCIVSFNSNVGVWLSYVTSKFDPITLSKRGTTS